ncbi:thioesterase family protein [Aspergillus taichungensis]|uniref:Thioesterase family protein n=1 Tax=Aspergillus taichungensis TaxID=482145 RepID=A0A2J5HG55_9EURO|nr:thioesterase family protein [Aspergillus taichungensis]
MFGPRRVLQSRLRLLAPQSISLSRFQASRNASSVAPNPTTEPSKWPRRLVYAAIFGSLGTFAGKWMDEKVSAPPRPGSEEDRRRLEDIHHVYEHQLPIVKKLRNNPDYIEDNVYVNYSDDDKMKRFTSGLLRGSRGVAFQKIFWNDKEKKAVNIVYLGTGIEGWPTVVHGGALGTIIDEHLGRAAVRHLPERTGVTANLEINYRAPVFSGHFYTFYATLDQERSTDRKAYVTGEVRDPMGQVCAQASGLFVVPKKYELRTLGDRF